MDPRTKSQELDTQPWYRQFWPWFVILLPASAVVASLYTVNLAVHTTDSLVVDADLGMDVISAQHVAAAELAASLGLRAELELDRETGAMILSIHSSRPNPAATAPESVVLRFSHPAFEEKDQSVILQRPAAANDLTYTARLPVIPPGRWYLILESVEGWRMTANLASDAQTVSFGSGPSADGTHGE